MGLIIHHLGHSQSDRVVFLAEELGLDYELKKYDRAPVLAPKEYKALHPLGAAPVIEDGDVKLAETEACVEYIINIHGNGRLTIKPGANNYADYLYWYYLTNGTLQPAAGRFMALVLAGVAADNATYKRYQQKVYDVLQMVDARLSQATWLAGDEFTAADVMIVFSLTTMREMVPFDLSAYKNILPYLEKLVARPAYQRYLKKGDPDIDIEKFIRGPPPPRFAAMTKHK